jgi:hypothetical protein
MKTEREAQQFATPPQVRQNTFYTFMPYAQRAHIEQVADSRGEAFRGSYEEEKWWVEYCFEPNNKAFLTLPC